MFYFKWNLVFSLYIFSFPVNTCGNGWFCLLSIPFCIQKLNKNKPNANRAHRPKAELHPQFHFCQFRLFQTRFLKHTPCNLHWNKNISVWFNYKSEWRWNVGVYVVRQEMVIRNQNEGEMWVFMLCGRRWWFNYKSKWRCLCCVAGDGDLIINQNEGVYFMLCGRRWWFNYKSKWRWNVGVYFMLCGRRWWFNYKSKWRCLLYAVRQEMVI